MSKTSMQHFVFSLCSKSKVAHTRLWALGISHKPCGRLPLLSTRPPVSFTAKDINPRKIRYSGNFWYVL